MICFHDGLIGICSRRWGSCQTPYAQDHGLHLMKTWRLQVVGKQRKFGWRGKSLSSMASVSSWVTWLALGSLSHQRAYWCTAPLTACLWWFGLLEASSPCLGLCAMQSLAPPSPSLEPVMPTSWSRLVAFWLSFVCGRPSCWLSRPARLWFHWPLPTTCWSLSTQPASRRMMLSASLLRPVSVRNTRVWMRLYSVSSSLQKETKLVQDRQCNFNLIKLLKMCVCMHSVQWPTSINAETENLHLHYFHPVKFTLLLSLVSTQLRMSARPQEVFSLFCCRQRLKQNTLTVKILKMFMKSNPVLVAIQSI